MNNHSPSKPSNNHSRDQDQNNSTKTNNNDKKPLKKSFLTHPILSKLNSHLTINKRTIPILSPLNPERKSNKFYPKISSKIFN